LRKDEFLQRGEKLWRARLRLQRGDTGQASLLFADLFERYRGQTNEAALIVAEGLLRCRIAHGENDRAVLAALECARLRRARITTDRYEQLPPVFDAETQLCVQLPPAWQNSRQLRAVKVELERYQSAGDDVVQAFASLYLVAVSRTMGEAAPMPALLADVDHPGVVLLREIVAASDPDIEVRQRCVERWQELLGHEAVATWAVPWVRFAVGRSGLQSTNPRTREEGVVQLLHVPVQHAATQPYLAGLALAAAERELTASGDATSAHRLHEELRALVPNHPVLRVEGPQVEAALESHPPLKGR
jgi:hypothetical protein